MMQVVIDKQGRSLVSFTALLNAFDYYEEVDGIEQFVNLPPGAHVVLRGLTANHLISDAIAIDGSDWTEREASFPPASPATVRLTVGGMSVKNGEAFTVRCLNRVRPGQRGVVGSKGVLDADGLAPGRYRVELIAVPYFGQALWRMDGLAATGKRWTGEFEVTAAAGEVVCELIGE
jgi:hypothetical protein